MPPAMPLSLRAISRAGLLLSTLLGCGGIQSQARPKCLGQNPARVVQAAGGVAIARGSAMECAVLLDVCRVSGLISDDKAKEGKALLARIVAMLTRMCRA